MNIENKKQLATILLAVGLGLVAAMLMSKVISDKVDEQTKVIAKEYQGRSSAMVKELEVTKQTLNKLASDHAALAKRVAERPAVQPIAPAPTPEKPKVKDTAFSLKTPPGKRAMTIRISSLLAVGGLINAGDFVDILGHLTIPNDELGPQNVTTVLFQNIQILAVGTNFNQIEEAPPPYGQQQGAGALNVTLALTPEEAGLLTFSQAKGHFQFTLRSPSETEDKILHEATSWDALADFLIEQQGTELNVPQSRPVIQPVTGVEEIVEEDEPAPTIQIFRGGREL